MLAGMTSSRSLRRRAAWAVPAITAAAIAAAALLPSTASADPHPALPERTPAQLLAAVQGSSVQHLSGTIVETARLGLPALPGANDTAALNWQTLITGTHTARVWFDGKDKQRLALLGQLSETDIIRNGNDVWSYASAGQKVGHVVQTPPKAEQSKTPDATDLTTQTPLGAADQALKAIDPSTVVSVDRTARVADRPAYTLVLTPRDTRSTVRKVLIAVDASRNVPLRVQVFGASSTPAFETGFTDISFSQPAASVFQFTPPKGVTVTHDLFGTTGPSRHRVGNGKAVTTPAEPPAGAAEAKGAGPKILGTGWTSVAEFPASADGSSPLAGLSGGSSELLGRLTTSLPGGARLIKSALINVLITADGRLLVGAVSPDLLQSYAAGHTG
jgi:outer membrane lipoprotein-sorting protein